MNAIEALKQKVLGMPDEVVITLTTQQAKAILDQLEEERQRADELEAAAAMRDDMRVAREEFAALRGEQKSEGNEFLPNNLDRALMVMGMALPESKEEFNFHAERWMQRLIDRIIRFGDEIQVAEGTKEPVSQKLTDLPYDVLFNAIAKSVTPLGEHMSISVKDFKAAIETANIVAKDGE